MKEFRSLEDVERARLPDHVAGAVRGTLEGLINAYAEMGEVYDPESGGWTVLIEQGDTDDVIGSVIGGSTLRDAPFEGIVREGDLFVAVWLANNEFGMSLVVPDEPWLDPEVRAKFMADCEGR